MDHITDVQCIHDKYEIHHGIEQASGCLPCHGDVDLIISYCSYHTTSITCQAKVMIYAHLIKSSYCTRVGSQTNGPLQSREPTLPSVPSPTLT